MVQPLIELRDISKSFGGIHALKGAQLQLAKGEVHALLGENGAGKSTLMRVLGGEIAPDSGTLFDNGEAVQIKGPKQAMARGITLIHQEMALAPELTVAENIYLHDLPGFISWPKLRAKARNILRRLGFDIDPAATVGDLSVAHQQIVEIARALSQDARVIVFDEPTAVLSTQDANRLLDIISDLRSVGVAIVYISHRLDEVFRIADRMTIMKDGQWIATETPQQTSLSQVIRQMVGRPVDQLFSERENRQRGKEILRVEGLNARHKVRDVSFSVHAGEVVGLGGLVGAGRTEVARLIFGADRSDSGSIFLHGKQVALRTPQHAVRAGIALVPEDRKRQGVVLDMPIKANVTMANDREVMAPLGFIQSGRENAVVGKLAQQMRLKCAGLHAPVSSLSGGNQQKVVLAKWFNHGGEVIILDEPTRGVDVGAKREIYQLIAELADQGLAVIVISSEHLELFGLCDRVLVMSEGAICGELQPADYSEAKLLSMAMTNRTSLLNAENF
ncbi:lantibiotic ABC transporter permease [Izhakiella australiensis]|uniref:Lantibiotic ABC transporter permease n=1 Tax=Izhakiella australiensis TaxID=1926881 RepID=A0A1S8YIG8_9GAMM|nr:sugar ABC transporter ATP-binding protein [Izhakiella australiensis]OON38688.1 lantibiotic ABC transporter permease [Izhakiella australiensis]